MGSVNHKPIKPLTHKQSTFCYGMVQGLSQTEAYRAAYPGTKMSTKTMKEAASRLMRASNVIATIESLKAPAIKRVQATYEQWLQEIEAAAFCDARKYFTETGDLIPVHQLGDGEGVGLAGFEVVEIFAGQGEDRRVIGQTKKIKLGNKLSALELFGKATGYYQEKVEAPQSVLEMASTEFLVAMLQELKEKKARAMKVVN